MPEPVCCPECGGADLMLNEKRQQYTCKNCDHRFGGEHPFVPLRIFLSYGHDEHVALAERLKADLQARGHEVWFDVERLTPGDDWECYIEEGLEWVAAEPGRGRIVLLMTPHSVRRPDGYCLNEIARALARRLQPLPVMVVLCEPPLSICRIQWLDMTDCVPLSEREPLYEARRDRLLEALEQNRLDFEGSQARLLNLLKPLPFDADLDKHLERFVGRQWVFSEIDAWLADPSSPRIFWLTGSPGVGKTAIAAWLCRNRRAIAAFHLCQHGHTEKGDPRRAVLSIAYQLSTQLPDYQDRLAALDLEGIAALPDAGTLFDRLLVQPLADGFPDPGRPLVVLIDALDEATLGGRNALALFLASEFTKTPSWLRLVLTSRPDPEVTHPLQGLTMHVLDTSLPENEADLKLYMEREFAAYAAGGAVPEATLNALLARSEGLFLYVECVREDLQARRLSLERLDQFPQGLGGVYARFCDRQFGDLAAFRREVRPALELMVAAREPLLRTHLRAILRWDDYAERDFYGAVGSFVVGEERVRVFHRSLTDWLTDGNRAGHYLVSVQEGHRRLAEAGWQEYQAGVDHLSPYMLSHLADHLVASGRGEELVPLLTDYGFVDAKLRRVGVQSLIEDYEQAETAPGLGEQEARALRLIGGALRLSAHVVGPDPDQLPSQLWGRLVEFEDAAPRVLLSKAKENTTCPWLRPVSASLTPPGGPLLRTLVQHTSSGRTVAVPDESRRVVSASLDGTLKVWDLDSGVELFSLDGHPRGVESLAVTADGQCVISGSYDGTLKLWDLETRAELRTLRGHSDCADGLGWVMDVAAMPDGRGAITASGDKTLKVWDLETGAELRTLTGHAKAIRAVAVTPDGNRAISASDDKTLKVWDLDTGAELATLAGHNGEVWDVAVTPDGCRAISASTDKTVRIWNLVSGEQSRTLTGHTKAVFAVAVTPDGRWAISASADRTLKVWDLQTGVALYTLTGHSDSVVAVTVTPDGRRAVSASADHTMRVWDLRIQERPRTASGHSAAVLGVAVTLAGRCAVSASDDHTLKVWDLETGAELHALGGHTSPVAGVAVTAGGRRAVSASADNTLKVWDLGKRAELRTLAGHTKVVFAVVVTPCGQQAISGSDDKTLKVWDLESGLELRTLTGHTGTVRGAAVTPDGRQAISASDDKTLRVWDLEAGMELWALHGHTESVSAVAMTPDGSRAVSASWDNTLKIWDLEAGVEVLSLRGHMRPVSAVAVTPDGRRAVSASWDNTLKVWDLEDHTVVCTFSAETTLWSCGVAPDGTIVAGDGGGEVHFLRLENVTPGPPITTAWIAPGDSTHAFGCLHCRVWSEVPPSALGAELPCPNCGRAVKLNPFVIEADWRPVAAAWRGET